MALKLMYITNSPEVALIAEKAGTDRIFVDMEYIGKSIRQSGMDTVQSRHTVEDVKNVRRVISDSELLVRVNPIHDESNDFCSSKDEIDSVIESGSDIVMLPYFKTVSEVDAFLNYVNGRAKTMLLLETPEAVEVLDDIFALGGIDGIHIGINDLSLGYRMKFMFQLVADGTVENLCRRIEEEGIPYGFGGIASLGKGVIPAELIIKEHYRVGSTSAILSRSFCDSVKIGDLKDIEELFNREIRLIREFEKECEMRKMLYSENKEEIYNIVQKYLNGDQV